MSFFKSTTHACQTISLSFSQLRRRLQVPQNVNDICHVTIFYGIEQDVLYEVILLHMILNVNVVLTCFMIQTQY